MTVHYTEERLSYLRSICKEFTSLGDIAKAYIFPNDAQKHCTIEAAIKYPGLEIQTLGPTPLGHPHLLAWCHQAKARELFHADPSISHFPYREDDIHITKANLIWWLQARKQLQKYGPYPGLLRYEVHPNTKEHYSSDVIAPAIYEDTILPVFKDGGYAFLNLPPLPLAGPSPNGSGTHGGILANARCGNQQDQLGNPRKGESRAHLLEWAARLPMPPHGGLRGEQPTH